MAHLGFSLTPGSTPGATTETAEHVNTTTTGGDHGTGGGGEHAEPLKEFSFSLEDGGEPINVDLNGIDAEEHEPEELTFESLKSKFAEDDPNQQETYKALKKPLSENARYKKLFPSPEAAVEHNNRIEELGSKASSLIGNKDLKGLDSIDTYVEASSKVLRGLQSGDVETVKQMFSNNPQALAKMAATLASNTDLWYKADPQGWQKHHSKMIYSAFTKAGADGVSPLQALVQAFNKTDDPDLKALLNKVYGPIETMEKWTKFKAADPAAADPAITAKMTELQKKEMELFNKSANTKLDEVLADSTRRVISKLVTDTKTTGVTSQQRTEYSKIIIDQFQSLIKKDADFQAKLTKAYNDKDEDGIVSLVKAATKKYMSEAAKALIKQKFMPKKGDVKNEVANKRESTGGSADLSKAVKYTGPIKNGGPDVTLLDYPRMKEYTQKTGKNMLTDSGKHIAFYLKGKQEVYYI